MQLSQTKFKKIMHFRFDRNRLWLPENDRKYETTPTTKGPTRKRKRSEAHSPNELDESSAAEHDQKNRETLKRKTATRRGAGTKHQQQQQQQRRVVRSTRKLERVGPTLTFQPLEHASMIGLHQEEKEENNKGLRISDMKQMFQEFPHLCTDKTTDQRCVAGLPAGSLQNHGSEDAPTATEDHEPEKQEGASSSASSSSSSSPAVLTQKQLNELKLQAEEKEWSKTKAEKPLIDAETDPHAIMQKFLNRVPQTLLSQHLFSNKDDHKACVELVRQEKAQIPIHTAEFENRLLAEAGVFYDSAAQREIEFPPCCLGPQCIGNTAKCTNDTEGFRTNTPDKLKYKKFTLVAAMFEEEYDALLKSNKAPRNIRQRLCVLDTRLAIQNNVIVYRMAHDRSGQQHAYASQTPPLDKFTVTQQWGNLVDCEGGYFRPYILQPSETGYEGLLTDIAQVTLSALVAKQDPQTKRWYVDQTATVWVPQPSKQRPEFGQDLQTF